MMYGLSSSLTLQVLMSIWKEKVLLPRPIGDLRSFQQALCLDEIPSRWMTLFSWLSSISAQLFYLKTHGTTLHGENIYGDPGCYAAGPLMINTGH